MSLFPIEIPIGVAKLPAHLVFETLGYTLGFRYYVYLRKKRGDAISDEHRLMIFIGAALGGLLGSHLLGFLESPAYWQDWRVLANKTGVGGLLAGLAGVEWVKKRLGVTESSGDLMVFPLLLGQILGRMGCLLTGVADGTWGNPSALPWAFDAGDGVLRHPTPLYEIILLAVLWVGIRSLERRFTLINGARFKLYLASYLLFRLLVETIKPVYLWSHISISSIQIACLLGLLYYHKVWIKPHHLIDSTTS